MKFTHIHSSSLHVKPSASLEAATDRYYGECSILTLTEVRHEGRLRAVAEKGWGVVSRNVSGMSDVTISYDLETWTKLSSKYIRLYGGIYKLANGKPSIPLYAATAILRHRTSGHKLLVCNAHMPPTVGGANSWVSVGAAWQGRRKAYQQGIKTWSRYVEQTMRTQRPDLVLVCADWNLGWHRGWVRQYMHQAWKGTGLKSNWQKFSGPGTYGNRFIDGSMYRGMTSPGSYLIRDDPSSDHRPYKEAFETVSKPNTPLKPGTGSGAKPDPVQGGGGYGDPWWGFGDYEDDEIYHVLTF